MSTAETPSVEKVFAETKAVFEVLVSSKFLEGNGSFPEKFIVLSNISNDFFEVCECLHDSPITRHSQPYSFQHRVMAHAFIVIMKRDETITISDLDEKAVLRRYDEDWSSQPNALSNP